MPPISLLDLSVCGNILSTVWQLVRKQYRHGRRHQAIFITANVHAEMFAAPLMMKGGIKGAGEGEVAQVNTWLGPSQLTRPIVLHRTPDCFYRERTVIGPRVPGTRRLIRNMSSPSQHTFYRRSRGHGTGADPQECYRP